MYLCEECGSTDVEVKAWVKPNDINPRLYWSADVVWAILDDVQGFCFDCNKQTDIEYDDEYEEEE